MYNNEFFVVDMASCTSTGEIINNLSLALETLNHSGKKIVLKLNDSHLNQSQMLSIQSLITSYGCTLDTVETINLETTIVAENMNIFVQKPLEKRVEDKYKEEEKSEFKPFSIEIEPEKQEPIVKEVNGLRFEANLDAIQQQQENINITSDLKEAGINPKEDFESIGDKISSQYKKPQDVMHTVDEFTKPTVNEISDAEKNSISVYKKAYDEEVIQEGEWGEDVDFYETTSNDPVVSDSKNTTYITQTLRSGQILESDGNVVIIGDCHPGSEIRAIGDINVWGVLSGIAHAGYKGNTNARVRALKLNAVQLRIANCYSRRPDGTNIPYVLRSSVFTPEEARIVDNEIVLFKVNQN